jgi:protein-S-isoprenylcysteine O-methyltransferase Ste14
VADLALVLWGLYGVLAVVLPIALQVRRTGATGLKGVSGKPGSIEWLAGVGLVVAIAVGVTAAALAASGDVEPVGALDRAGVHAAGVALYAVGLATIVFSQQWMGRSWRIGVDERERTRLVTGGPFTAVRNPIFTGMILTSAGLALMVPSVLSFAGVAVLIASLEVQTRLVEEPYLTRVHGDEYTGWASRAGRFLPGLGRLH